MSEFVRLIREKPALQPLITSGSLGSIFVFRDEQCLAKKGYFLIGAAPRRNAAGEIYLGYFTQANYDPTEFLRFTTPSAAEASFEALLTAHGFLS